MPLYRNASLSQRRVAVAVEAFVNNAG